MTIVSIQYTRHALGLWIVTWLCCPSWRPPGCGSGCPPRRGTTHSHPRSPSWRPEPVMFGYFTVMFGYFTVMFRYFTLVFGFNCVIFDTRKKRFFLGPAGSWLGFALWGVAALDSLRSFLSFHSFNHLGLPFGYHSPSLWSPMSIPLVIKVNNPFGH